MYSLLTPISNFFQPKVVVIPYFKHIHPLRTFEYKVLHNAQERITEEELLPKIIQVIIIIIHLYIKIIDKTDLFMSGQESK